MGIQKMDLTVTQAASKPLQPGQQTDKHLKKIATLLSLPEGFYPLPVYKNKIDDFHLLSAASADLRNPRKSPYFR